MTKGDLVSKWTCTSLGSIMAERAKGRGALGMGAVMGLEEEKKKTKGCVIWDSLLKLSPSWKCVTPVAASSPLTHTLK
jgi:hypothetical protein